MIIEWYLQIIYCAIIILMEEKNESWRSIVSILFLVYFTPIAAIPVWLISGWGKTLKWVATAISVLAIIVLSTTTYKGYKMTAFEQELAPIIAVQQTLDLYGLANGKYPDSLDQIEERMSDLPSEKIIEYAPSADGSSYVLKARVEGKDIELGPALKEISNE